MNNDEHKEITITHSEILKKHDIVITDHEKRVRWLEKVAFYVIGAIMIAKFLWDLYSHATVKGT
jgi:hypothetical protein